ncbi:MAG TPA: GNAT family N-acetyltransferase [Steroidobacteraceae bacterium]|nr:GNAT family N-acetyltransferase [Steroidobacteraceae bacterium]
MIRHVTDSELERIRAFLEQHADSSLFLLSTLAALGPRLGEHPNSGNYQFAEEAGRVVAVFCLTRRGNLLVQAGGRADLAAAIFAACAAEPIELRGIVGEWDTAHALWGLLSAEPSFEPTHYLKDILYRLRLAQHGDGSVQARHAHAFTVRALDARDFVQWERLNSAYHEELHLPLQATREQRHADYLARVRSGLWWGACDDRSELTSIAALNATYGSLGQVGGVYTRRQDRRKGLARSVIHKLIADCRERLGFNRLVLFTGEDNHGARGLYESLGFEVVGVFGLLLGRRSARAASGNARAGRGGAAR